MIQLSHRLVESFNKFFQDQYGKPRSFCPSQLIGPAEGDLIVANLDKIHNPADIARFIGGEALDGQLEMLYNCIVKFQGGSEWLAHLKELDDYNVHIASEMQRIQNLKKQIPANQPTLPALASQTNKEVPPSKSTEAENRPTSSVSRVSKKRPSPAEIAQNKITRAEKKREKDEKEATVCEAKKRKWEEDKVQLDRFKEAHKRSKPS
jgi:hypothetical protein